MLNATKEIIAAVSAAIGVLATGVPFFIGFLRKARQLVKERNWAKISAILPTLITQAEGFTNYLGAEKKEYVKSRLAVYAVKHRIAFDEGKFDETIDGIVKLTKEVNVREKDKAAATATAPTVQNVLPLARSI
jgi:hypothetical protein